MSGKPDDIPEDVWDAAWLDYFARCDSAAKLAANFEEDEVIDLLCRARLAERERCADIADFGVKWTPVPTGDAQKIVDESCARIAAAIRKGTP